MHSLMDIHLESVSYTHLGKIIAIVHRNDDVEVKWVIAPEGMTFTKEEIRE